MVVRGGDATAPAGEPERAWRVADEVAGNDRKGGPAGRRERVLHRDGFRCVYCGEPFLPELLTLDHVEPRMRGGDQSEGNLVSCCSGCNALKGGQPAWSFLADRPETRERFLSAARQPAGTGPGSARPVWPRLIRAIEEAAERATVRRPGPAKG
jgi:hypothetical protein